MADIGLRNIGLSDRCALNSRVVGLWSWVRGAVDGRFWVLIGVRPRTRRSGDIRSLPRE